MAEFTPTTTVKKSLLTFPALLTLAQHIALVTEILTNPFGFGSVEQTESEYAYVTRMLDADGKKTGSLRITTPVGSSESVPYGYANLTSDLSIPAPAFTDATESHDETDDCFHARFRCGNDTEVFYLTLDRAEMVVSSYEDDAIVTAVSTWANTKTELGGDGGGE